MRIKMFRKRKKNPFEQHINALESFRIDMKEVMGKTIETMNSTKTILRNNIQININNASNNLKSSKRIFEGIKELDFIKKQSKFRVFDANDFILM